jgi:hypothetical protein
MTKVLKTIITITIILTDYAFSFSQGLTGLTYSHSIINAIAGGDKSFTKSTIDSIEFVTEFFDDFSDYHYSVFPRNDHWADRYAYINSSYPDSMLSLGVATLDAFNERGYPYYSIDSSGAVHSDTLTSQPFNFLNELTGKVFFSFFFQAGGKGDPPEGIINDIPNVIGEDSLILEFYSVTDTVWDSAFYTLDNTNPHLFKQVVLQVDTHYLKNGFRFRFRNYTSLPSGYQQGQDAGIFSNADQWHIDYIQMKQAASSEEMSILKDITIVKPLLPTLTEYTAVPWRHLTLAQTACENSVMPFTMRNFDANNGSSFDVLRIFQIYNLRSQAPPRVRSYTNPIFPDTQFTFQDSLRAGYAYDNSDTMGIFEIIAHIEPNIGVAQKFVNDTVKRREVFYDQYAYDDGSAEFGLGVGGEFQENTRIAQRYRIFRRSNNPDTLQAVLIYFCKSVDSTTADYTYSISIRKNDGIIPASANLYTSDTLSPDYSLHMNEFTRIEIDPPIIISDTFFVVVNQIDGYLNIGYDINHSNTDKIFVYKDQVWKNPSSLEKGSLMIRPSFKNYSLPTDVKTNEPASEKLLVYPNPVSDILYFTLPDHPTRNTIIQVFNSMGKLQIQTISTEASIPVSALFPGVYFIVLASPDGNYRQTAKFIKE